MPNGLLFYMYVEHVLNLCIFAVAVLLQAVAFVHCLVQRADGFPAIGTLPKGGWLAIIGLCLALTWLFGPISLLAGTITRAGAPDLFGLIGIAASLIYLLDVRVGLRDLSDGKGFW
jgi:hypothetical protein